MVIFAIGDSNNTPPPDGMAPIVLLFLILGIGAALGSQTAYAINPARDLGPRLMLWCAGYGTELWTAYNAYFIWYARGCPGWHNPYSSVFQVPDSCTSLRWSRRRFPIRSLPLQGVSLTL